MSGQQSVAVVTGAASGIGLATAEAFAAEGRTLLLCDLDAAGLEAIRLPGARLVGDISDPAFGVQMAAALGRAPIGALVHAAGVSAAMAAPARILEVNLAATLRLVDAALPLMAAAGAIVLLSSIGGHVLGGGLDGPIDAAITAGAVAGLMPMSRDGATAYAISKRGVQRLALRAARSYAERGARIVSLSPGIVDTPMGRIEFEREPAMHAMVAASAMARTASAEEIAAVAAFLCSPAASFVTGTDFLVDGGTMADFGRPTFPDQSS